MKFQEALSLSICMRICSDGSLVAPLETYRRVFGGNTLVEENELILNYLSGRLQTIYWTFLTKEQQHNSTTKNRKSTF